MPIQLTVMSLDFESFEQPLSKVYNKSEITLGRHSTNDVILDRSEVSGIHARIRVKASGDKPALYVTDLGSSNGTMVESNPLKAQVEVAILPNQRIIIGTYLIKPTLVDGVIEEDSDDSDEPTVERAVLVEGASISASGSYQSVAQGGSEEVKHRDSPTARMARDHLESIKEAAKDAEFPAHESGHANGVDEYANGESTMNGHETNGLAHFGAKTIAPEPAVAPVHVDASSSSLEVVVDADLLDDFDFVARELLTFSGAVLHKGTPLAGASVDLGEHGSCVTDVSGLFSFEGIPEGERYELKVTKTGYEFEFTGAASGNLERSISIDAQAHQVFTVRGAVTHKGKPLAGVTISSIELGSRTTDAEGKFAYDRIREGSTYKLTASKEKFIFEAPVDSGRVGTSDVTCDFTAKELFAIRGRVMHRGVPMAGVEVDGGELGKTITGGDGYYVFENVPEDGKHLLTASKDGYVFGTIRSKSQ